VRPPGSASAASAGDLDIIIRLLLLFAYGLVFYSFKLTFNIKVQWAKKLSVAVYIKKVSFVGYFG